MVQFQFRPDGERSWEIESVDPRLFNGAPPESMSRATIAERFARPALIAEPTTNSQGEIMPTALVVDQHDDDRTHVCEVLRGTGCQILEAASLDEAAAIARSERPDLIVTDLFLPGRFGLLFIRSMLAELEGVKIIAMSEQPDLDSTDYQRLAMDCGAILSFTKPVSQIDLISAVSEVLGNR